MITCIWAGAAALCSSSLGKVKVDALQVDDMTLDVTELPVRKWTQDYKEFLEGLIKPEEKAGPAVLADYREHHSDADVHFSLQVRGHSPAPEQCAPNARRAWPSLPKAESPAAMQTCSSLCWHVQSVQLRWCV